MSRVEKNCKKHTGPKERRDLKRAVRRARRRSERRDVENAIGPVREVTRGWSD